MFPYPSGNGLHVGHPLGYTATDIYSRFKRLNGYNVFIQWDGMHLDCLQNNMLLKQARIQKRYNRKNIQNFKRQIKSLRFFL